jgi:predicted RNase H-like HicB family nuclease
MRQYIALIHKDSGSDYGVSFPDLPGCVTAGKDLDDARVMAQEALALHLEGLAEDGDPAPEPSSLKVNDMVTQAEYQSLLAGCPGIPFPDGKFYIADQEWIDGWLNTWELDAPQPDETYDDIRLRALTYLDGGGWAPLGYPEVVGRRLGLNG